MNFNTVFRWHFALPVLILLTFRAAAAGTLLILGDSLPAPVTVWPPARHGRRSLMINGKTKRRSLMPAYKR